MPYIYMLTDESNYVLYTGVTNDLERRMNEHRSGEIEGFTKKYGLHKLVYCEQWESMKDAIHREKQLKGWSRSKKDALIASYNKPEMGRIVALQNVILNSPPCPAAALAAC